MIVIVGRATDPPARALLRRWQPHGAALLTPGDLSQRGWRYDPQAPLAGCAVVAGRAVAAADIRGAVTALQTVTVADIPHIVSADRAYVANEMRAFMVSWLQALPCPMLNRPTALSLAGCAWGPERWSLAASSLGIPAVSSPVDGTLLPHDAHSVTFVGGEVLDAPSARVAGWVRRLARAAATNTLVARFLDGARPRFAGASILPDFGRADVAAAALQWLGGERS
jgi:hypothetical protein